MKPNTSVLFQHPDMKGNLKERYFEKFSVLEVKDLIERYIELQYIYQQSLKLFLLHPSPPYKEEDIKFLKHIQFKIECLKEVLHLKTRK